MLPIDRGAGIALGTISGCFGNMAAPFVLYAVSGKLISSFQVQFYPDDISE